MDSSEVIDEYCLKCKLVTDHKTTHSLKGIVKCLNCKESHEVTRKWKIEPDSHTWSEFGLKCRIQRVGQGHLCGYVTIPEGKAVSYESLMSFRVHGGITYGEPEEEGAPAVGEIGFDANHSSDFSPREFELGLSRENQVYRDMQFMISQATALAEQVFEELWL